MRVEIPLELNHTWSDQVGGIVWYLSNCIFANLEAGTSSIGGVIPEMTILLPKALLITGKAHYLWPNINGESI
jgi:hypothetical protein